MPATSCARIRSPRRAAACTIATPPGGPFVIQHRESQQLEQLEQQRRVVLKEEPEALVELLGIGASAVVRKTYRNRGIRWWQTFARRSRAEREFENLQHIDVSGTTCPRPLDWSAKTRFGFVNESALVTSYLPDCTTLKSVLADEVSDRNHAERQTLISAAGRLVGNLHRSGFLWCTPMPRNMLVVGDPAKGSLAACDTPQGIAVRRSVHATSLALIDLFDAAFSPSRCKDYSRTERLRWLLGYCDGDHGLTRRLWRTLSRRKVWRHDLTRALAVFWFVYILRPLRGHRSPNVRTS